MNFLLNSPAFTDGSPIPARYTHDGEDVSPPLEWSGAPEGTRGYVLGQAELLGTYERPE